MRCVLVCSGRNYDDAECVKSHLDRLHADEPIDVLIEGGAQGADELARWWARDNGIEVETYVADWHGFGRRAELIRNQRMIDEGRPTLVVAFPGGAGTADMVRRAREANVKVVMVEEDS